MPTLKVARHHQNILQALLATGFTTTTLIVTGRRYAMKALDPGYRLVHTFTLLLIGLLPTAFRRMRKVMILQVCVF